MQKNRAWMMALLLAALPAVGRAEGVQAVSKPSADVTLNFTRPGRVLQVLVKEGDTVKADQTLVKLDNREEQAAYVQDKAKAEDVTKIDAQKAIKAQKELEARKLEDGFKRGAVSEWERNEAVLNVLVEDARLKLTNFEHDMDVLKANQTSIALSKMELQTPIAGVVESTLVKPGESVEPQTKVVRVVNINPLWVEVPVPYAQAIGLKKEQAGTVTFSDKSTGEGKVIHIASVADAGSGTLLVRLEVPNPALKPAGDRVFVDFGAGKVAAK